MMDINNFQRVGSKSNAHAGNEFEEVIQTFFAEQGINLARGFAATVGVGKLKKAHRFDLGSDDPALLIECKSHTWTQGGNSPSAKLTVWNEAMYYFHIAPKNFRKILFVLKHMKRDISLASHYLNNYGHLVPDDVEIWEYCDREKIGERIR